MVATLGEYAIIVLMGRVSETTNNKVQSTTMGKKKLVPRTRFKMKKEKYDKDIGISGILKQIQDNLTHVLAEKSENRDCANKSINAIDFICFWVFLTAFILFNITYWNSY